MYEVTDTLTDEEELIQIHQAHARRKDGEVRMGRTGVDTMSAGEGTSEGHMCSPRQKRQIESSVQREDDKEQECRPRGKQRVSISNE